MWENRNQLIFSQGLSIKNPRRASSFKLKNTHSACLLISNAMSFSTINFSEADWQCFQEHKSYAYEHCALKLWINDAFCLSTSPPTMQENTWISQSVWGYLAKFQAHKLHAYKFVFQPQSTVLCAPPYKPQIGHVQPCSPSQDNVKLAPMTHRMSISLKLFDKDLRV